jgi:hypothetical protein
VETWGLKEAESDIDATLAGIKNLLLGGALLTTLASAILIPEIAWQAPEGAAPVESGTEPAPETPEEAARSQRLRPSRAAPLSLWWQTFWDCPRHLRSAPYRGTRALCRGSLAEHRILVS